jgi:two-component system, OmpR family, phosphate regulon sensor histidine kinase PhoR
MLQSGRVQTDAKRQEYLDIIVRESERLSALIENVLDFARLERGRGSYEFAEGDVGDAVTRAANVYRYRAEREGMQLLVDVEPNLPRAHIDERAIQLAVVNLVDNALKYAPDGEEIVVRVSAQGDSVRIDVIDRGPGVPADERQRIFERFVRLSSRSGESQVRGSGIGLALVKHIAESHGGRAWVVSRGEPDPSGSTGSTFSFSIPAARGRGSTGRIEVPEGRSKAELANGS